MKPNEAPGPAGAVTRTAELPEAARGGAPVREARDARLARGAVRPRRRGSQRVSSAGGNAAPRRQQSTR